MPSYPKKSLHMAVVLVAVPIASVAGADNDTALTTSGVISGQSADALDLHDATIGRISIENDNVFDLDDPHEDRWFYRLADAIHVTTRPHVIESQLLFSEGEPYSQQAADESARILRSNHYISEATIEPVRYEDGVVDLNVHTKDVWTLTADVSAGRQGGVNSGGFGLKEHNLFGTGTYLGAKYKSTVDRNTSTFQLANEHLLGGMYTAAALYSNNSDGFARELSFGRPFYSLDSRNMFGGSYTSSQRTDSLYDRGDIQQQFDHRLMHHELDLGWSGGLSNGWTRRLTTGIVYDDNRFSPLVDSQYPSGPVPDDRRFVYPYIGFEMLEDDYVTVHNFDQIERTEDLDFGTRLAGRIGYSAAAAGSTASGLHFDGIFSNGVRIDGRNTLMFGAQLTGRLMSGRGENVLFSTFANYHRQQSPKRLLYASLGVTAGKNIDLDNQLLLGGDNGLRGYPLRYQGGDTMALFTIEERLYTDWFPFRLFRVGGAVFFDAGRTWGTNPVGGPNLGLLRDIGVGLRVGNVRSASGRMLHLDLAFPLDGTQDISGVQLIIDAKSSF